MQMKWDRLLKAAVFSFVTFQHCSAYAGTCSDSQVALMFLRDSFTSAVRIDGFVANTMILEVQVRQTCLTTLNFQNDLIAYFPDTKECSGVSGNDIANLNRLLGEVAAFELLSRSREIVAKLQYGTALIYQSGNPLGAGSPAQADGKQNECRATENLIFSSGFESWLES
jgi:hypothetical protein